MQASSAFRPSESIGHMPYFETQSTRATVFGLLPRHTGAIRGNLAAVSGRGTVVGRAGDLSRIESVLDRALAEQPGAVLVLGEAGVGKTTMLHASIDLATQRDFATAVGSCADGASGTSFAPFR